MWYLKDRIGSEISIIKEHISNLNGLKKISRSSKSLDKFFRVVRNSKNSFTAKDVVIKEFKLSEGQSWFLLDMKLRDITSRTEAGIQEEIEYLEEVIRFLKKFKK